MVDVAAVVVVSSSCLIAAGEKLELRKISLWLIKK